MSYKKYAKFSPAAYKACDGTGKIVVVQWLNRQGIFAKAEEKHDADVKGLIPVKVESTEYEEVFYEVEIKSGWIGDWPESFDTVDIPHRKAKLLKKHPVNRLYFMVISGDLKQAWKISASVIDKKFYGNKDTTRKKAEKFIRVPVELCELINLEDITQ